MGCKWVFKVKYHASREVERYKARLVAKGYSQQEGLDYIEAFSPVAKMVTVMSVVVLAASYGWFLFQMDVHNAFFEGDLNEEVNMQEHEGFAKGRNNIWFANSTSPCMD